MLTPFSSTQVRSQLEESDIHIRRGIAAAHYINKILEVSPQISKRLVGRVPEDEPSGRLVLADNDYRQFLKAVVHETRLAGHTAGFGALAQEYFARQFTSRHLASTSGAAYFLKRYFEEAQARERLGDYFNGQSSPVSHVITKTLESHPIIGIIAAEAFASIRDPHSEPSQDLLKADPPRSLRGWYSTVMENIGMAWMSLESIFTHFNTKCFHEEQFLKFFLEDWKGDLEKFLIEAVSMTNTHALSVVESQGCPYVATSIIFWPDFIVPYGRSHKDVKKDIEPLVFEELRFQYGDVFSAKALKQRAVPVPLAHCVLDLIEYSDFLASYFSELEKAFHTQARKVPGKEGVLSLGDTFTIRCYPEAVQGKHQARISIVPDSNSQFRDFVLRVDRDDERALTFDVGNCDYDQAISIAHTVKESAVAAGEMVNYCAAVDSAGNISEPEFLAPNSIFQSECDVPYNNRISLMAVILSHAGRTMGTRVGQVVGHHVSESVFNRTNPRNFPRIVSNFESLLLRSSAH